MPRTARIVIPDLPHHVTHRGNDRRDVFLDDVDRRFYLRNFRKCTRKYGVRVWSYCLMTNHVHSVLLPPSATALARCMNVSQMTYALWFHSRYGGSGHLWGNRYYSAPVDWVHLMAIVRYVELNPVRAHMVDRATDHRWSSARAHCSMLRDPVLDSTRPLPAAIGDWAQWLAAGSAPEECDFVRSRTRTGRPLGGPEFIRELERLTGRSLTPGRSGRRPAAEK